MANKTITQLDAAQSLNDNMVIAVQDTNTTYKTTLADVKAYCGGGGSADKYKVGDRVNDDSNNPVGTVSSIFTDGNGDRYAVVCLDAVNRNRSTRYLYNSGTVTGLPIYGQSTWGPWGATETATFNTQKILDYCAANNTDSSSCTHCRSKSFIIDGVTYYGQLPNVIEVMEIMKNFQLINNQDPTASTSSTTNFSTGRNMWSSTQSAQYATSTSSSNAAFYGYFGGTIQDKTKGDNGVFAVPVLEIPLED